ncbi:MULTISPECIES: hypothetical protein [Saccharopolyspora]|nr:hypothetical protein [Saccharopolyspora elongata]
MTIRPPANYRVYRWLLIAVFAIAMLLTILGSAVSCTDFTTAVFGGA